jgi:transcriptional regulator with XRE-family HTH domain
MAENRIKQLRSKKGLTQRELAAAAETSQQQIQRIESGVQAARFDIAVRICAALGAPMEKVFPGTKNTLRKSAAKGNSISDLLRDEHALEELSEAGIEASGEVYAIKFLLRSGFMGINEISGQERKRLWTVVQDGDDLHNFVIFDTHSERVALNLKHLVFSQFLFDPISTKDDDTESTAQKLMVYTSVQRAPLEFGVDPDTEDLNDVDNGLAEDENAQLQSFIDSISMSTDENNVFSFMDEDGERAFFRAADVSMVTVPLSYIEPKLFESEVEGYEEENGDGGNPG